MIAVLFVLAVGCLVGLLIALAENALPTDTTDQKEQHP